METKRVISKTRKGNPVTSVLTDLNNQMQAYLAALKGVTVNSKG